MRRFFIQSNNLRTIWKWDIIIVHKCDNKLNFWSQSRVLQSDLNVFIGRFMMFLFVWWLVSVILEHSPSREPWENSHTAIRPYSVKILMNFKIFKTWCSSWKLPTCLTFINCRMFNKCWCWFLSLDSPNLRDNLILGWISASGQIVLLWLDQITYTPHPETYYLSLCETMWWKLYKPPDFQQLNPDNSMNLG